LLGAETVNYLQDLRKYFTEKIASSKSKCISSIVDWKEQMRAALFLSNLTKEDVNWLEVEDEVYTNQLPVLFSQNNQPPATNQTNRLSQ
jgi:hypothetical protein